MHELFVRVHLTKKVFKTGGVTQVFTELAIIDGVVISKTSNSSSCIGILSIAGVRYLGSVTGATDIGIITLKRFIGRIKSSRLGE